jgi:uncharacterized membrane protein
MKKTLMVDKFEEMTKKEMSVLEKVDAKETKEIKRDELKKSSDALVDALALLDHLEDQKEKLEARETIEEKLTYGQRLADKIAQFGGSWTFLIIFGLALLSWMALNILQLIKPWDPYPFILLNLCLSTVAAVQAPIIMMSQNRQTERDRYRDEIDFER